ncbi:MAG: peptidylprolyl isomerase [Planctomycetes bacterium]|nr:peptidylprolyl isomerase [Planctomycetota bacterium]
MRRTIRKWWNNFTQSNPPKKRKCNWAPSLEALEDRFTPAGGVLNPLPPGVISGLVFADSNNNNLRDAGENILPGVSITLSGTTRQGAPINQSTVSDATGVFSFLQVPAGTYQLTRGSVSSFVGDNASAGSLGGVVGPSTISNISLSPGQTGLNFLFAVRGLGPQGLSLGLFLNRPDAATLPTHSPGSGQGFGDGTVQPLHQAAAGANSLSGFVFNVHTPLAGVQVSLSGVDDSGTALARTTTTNSSGAYSFSGLRNGSYSLNLPIVPAGFRTDAPTIGSLGGVVLQNNVIGNIPLTASGTNYNFQFLPSAVAVPANGPSIAAELLDDTTGPDDTNGSTSDGITSDPTVQGSIVDSAKITSFTAAFNGAATNILGQLNANGRFLLNKAVLAGILGGSLDNLDLAPFTLHLRATDALGRTGAFNLSFTVDDFAPDVPTLTLDPANDDGHGRTTDAAVTLHGLTSPGAHVDLIQGGASLGTQADGGGNFQFSGVALNDGANNFFVRATDEAGNQSEFSTLIVKNRPPVAGTQATIVGAQGGADKIIDLSTLFTDPDISSTVVRFNTSAGPVNIQLFDSSKPQTVANFLNYLNNSAYDSSFFHRLVTDFVLQGGGFTFQNGVVSTITENLAVNNEFNGNAAFNNVIGTIAMAKPGGNPNGATDQFFFNLANNTSLDTTANNGGFTVFGKVQSGDDLRIINTLAAIPTQSQTGTNTAFTNLPLKNYTGTHFPTDATASNFALVQSAGIVSQPDALTYALDASVPSSVAEIKDQDRLVLHFTNAGSTTITITATDKSGQTATLAFTFTVA